MVQVINRGPSFGGNLGTAFGTGLGSGLQALAEHKMNEIQRQKVEDYLATRPGFDRQKARGFAALPQHLQGPELKNVFQGAQGENFEKHLNRVLGGAQQEQITPEGLSNGAGISPAQFKDVVKIGQNERKIEQKERHFNESQNANVEKHLSKGLDNLREKNTEAKTNLATNKILRELSNSGQLVQGLTADAAQKLGLPVSIWGNSPTELASKIIEQNIARGASKFAGSKSSARLLELMRTNYATLANTPVGFQAILDANDALYNKPEEIVYDAVQELRDKYESEGKKLPYNLLDRAEKVARPKIDKEINESIKLLTDKSRSKSQVKSGKKINSLPDPRTWPQDKALKAKDGRILISNGTDWIEKGEE